jgi:hypothetical protein
MRLRADLQNLDLTHILRKGDGLRQPYGLTAIGGEHGGLCHSIIPLYIQLGYTWRRGGCFCKNVSKTVGCSPDVGKELRRNKGKNINMLGRRFAIAPMMDGTLRAGK